jgi:hypothetical protein
MAALGDISQESLKAYKMILRDAYGIKDPFGYSSKNELKVLAGIKNEKKIITNEEKEYIYERTSKLLENSHELLAYRIAFGIPTSFTAINYLNAKPIPLMIID